MEDFDPVKHLQEDRFWNEIEGNWCAKNQLWWYIRRGQSILKEELVQHSFYRVLKSAGDLGGLTVFIHLSHSETPESRWTKDVQTFCAISVDLDSSIWYSLPRSRNHKGLEYRILNYSITMEVSAGDIIWRVMYKGEEKVQARVECEVHTRCK